MDRRGWAPSTGAPETAVLAQWPGHVLGSSLVSFSGLELLPDVIQCQRKWLTTRAQRGPNGGERRERVRGKAKGEASVIGG